MIFYKGFKFYKIIWQALLKVKFSIKLIKNSYLIKIGRGNYFYRQIILEKKFYLYIFFFVKIIYKIWNKNFVNNSK